MPDAKAKKHLMLARHHVAYRDAWKGCPLLRSAVRGRSGYPVCQGVDRDHVIFGAVDQASMAKGGSEVLCRSQIPGGHQNHVVLSRVQCAEGSIADTAG